MSAVSSKISSDRLLHAFASEIRKRRLEAPAILFLELYKPLTAIFHSALVAGLPLISAFVGAKRSREFTAFLESRENIEALVLLLEKSGNSAAAGEVENAAS